MFCKHKLVKPLGKTKPSPGLTDIVFVDNFVYNFLGHGVFATKEFLAGDFLLEYKGEVIDNAEGERRLSKAAKHESFIYFFETSGRQNMW